MEASEVMKTYSLLQIGLSYEDTTKIPYREAEKLLLLHSVINEEEEKKLEAEQKKHSRGRR